MTVNIKKSRAIGTLSLTPLIDIVFLLLIFFLVATRFAAEDAELSDIELPTASEAQPLISTPQELFINIDRDGKLYLGNQLVDAEQLRQHLEQAGVNNPLTQSAVVRADRRCDWQHVASAFDICQSAGIQVRPSTTPDRD